MSFALAVTFVPTYAPLPAYAGPGAVAISCRFPYPGNLAATPASGTSGLPGTITPERSSIEAAAWGATICVWSYFDLAASRGFASAAAFAAEFAAAGIPIQGATNTSAVSPSVGPFAYDLGGTAWTAGSSGARPALVSGVQNPLNSRIQISVTLMPASDNVGTVIPKGDAVSALMTAGAFGIQLDDPRGPAGYSGFKGIATSWDLTSQGVEFSTTGLAGFGPWLAVNTTAGERATQNLPADTTNFNLVTWLRTYHLAAMQAVPPSLQVDANALDNYLFRTSISSNGNRRDVVLGYWNLYLRQSQVDFSSYLKGRTSPGLFSCNLYQASPAEFVSGFVRRAPGLFDFAVSETAPDYWEDLLPYPPLSAEWLAIRQTQAARRHLNATTYDLCGLRAFVEHKPTALSSTTPGGSGFPVYLASGAPPAVVVRILRQSILQTVAEGHRPIIPIDVFLTINDNKSQGTNIDGYRYWGSRADFKDVFDFIKANSSYLEGYEKCSVIFLAAHNGSFPFYEGTSLARFNIVVGRLKELWARDIDYHWLTMGEVGGMLPEDPNWAFQSTSPFIIRIQDDIDYYAHLGRMCGSNCHGWSTAAANAAMVYAPARSLNPWVRVLVRYNPALKRVSIFLLNVAMGAAGEASYQTTKLVWNWGGLASYGTMVSLGEAASRVSLVGGEAFITFKEFAILNFQVLA